MGNLPKSKKVRYAVVGLGWISQAAFMPGVAHTGNSVMTALVTGSPNKAKPLAEQYGIEKIYSYGQYEEMLKSGEVDAVYLAVPNHLHLKFALPVLEAGMPLLLEKPMAINRQECEQIIEAAKATNAKLMLAYRLHFEPATLAAIAMVRSGHLGEPRLFTSTFAQVVSEDNHRSKNNDTAGPLLDMGPYPINAARNLFDEEPIEVFATASKFREPSRNTVDENVSVTMRFPEGKLAQFSVSYGGSAVDEYHVVGSKGHLRVNPSYIFESALKHYVTMNDSSDQVEAIDFPQTDQFGGQLQYFSQCILDDKHPEPDGYEGLADIAVIEAIQESIRTGTVQKVVPVQDAHQIRFDQKRTLEPVIEPDLIGAAKP